MVGAGPGALLGALAAALAAGNPVLTVLAAAETPPGLALLRRVVSATTGPGVVDVLGGSLPELAMALAPEGGVNVILDASGDPALGAALARVAANPGQRCTVRNPGRHAA